jgi:hypothetical protein
VSKNPDPDYDNREVKRLKIKVRKVYSRSKYSQSNQAELILLFKDLLLAKKKAQDTLLRSVLHNEGRCWAEFYKHVKRRRGNRKHSGDQGPLRRSRHRNRRKVQHPKLLLCFYIQL